MRSPGRLSSSASFQLAPATQPCVATMRAAAPRLVHDVPLPHDLVGDLIPVGLLSHTLHSFSAIPRPRVRLRRGVDLHYRGSPPCLTIAMLLRSSPRSGFVRSRPVRGRLIGTTIEAIDTSISSILMAPLLLLRDATAQTKHPDAWAYLRFTALQPHPKPSTGSRAALTCSPSCHA